MDTRLLAILIGALFFVLIIGLCLYGGCANRRASRRDLREYGREGLAAMLDNVPVGKCPFCGGEVRFGLECVDAGSFRTLKRECANGCPIHLLFLNATIPGRTVKEARGNASKAWYDIVDLITNPTVCGRCGAYPVWRVRASGCRLYCPKCGNEGPDGMTAGQAPDPAQAARLWNLGQGGGRRAKNLEDRLNAA